MPLRDRLMAGDDRAQSADASRRRRHPRTSRVEKSLRRADPVTHGVPAEARVVRVQVGRRRLRCLRRSGTGLSGRGARGEKCSRDEQQSSVLHG
jgi:hypothetical protein